MKYIAIILAGGSGSRMNNDKPKQFLEINGKTVIEYAVNAFENNEHITDIIVVVNVMFVNLMKSIAESNKWKKVRAIVNGGNERYESSYNAIKYLKDTEDAYLIFHDAARPLISNDLINRVVNALSNHDAVMTAIPSSDTIVEVNDEKDSVRSIPNRNFLMRVQTPQAFRKSLISGAYDAALAKNDFHFTDDCGVVKEAFPNERIHIVKGEERNLKITYESDLKIIAQLSSQYENN